MGEAREHRKKHKQKDTDDAKQSKQHGKIQGFLGQLMAAPFFIV